MRAVLLFLIAVIVFGLAAGLYYNHQMDTRYAALAALMPEDAVVAKMGKPSAISRSCEAYGTRMTANCDHVLVYQGAIPFANRKHWLVFIDPEGKMAARSMQVKP